MTWGRKGTAPCQPQAAGASSQVLTGRLPQGEKLGEHKGSFPSPTLAALSTVFIANSYSLASRKMYA